MTGVRISELPATRETVEAFLERFVCRRCGTCCTTFKGVKLKEDEMKRLDVPEAERDAAFMFIDGVYYLKEPCRFYDAGKTECNIYDDRPETCRHFPFNNRLCTDGLIHLGVTDSCEAALDTLAEVEVEFLGR